MKRHKNQEIVIDNSLTDLDLDVWGERKSNALALDHAEDALVEDEIPEVEKAVKEESEIKEIKEVRHHISFQEPTKLTLIQRVKSIAGSRVATIVLVILVMIALNMILNPSMTITQFINNVTTNIETLVNG